LAFCAASVYQSLTAPTAGYCDQQSSHICKATSYERRYQVCTNISTGSSSQRQTEGSLVSEQGASGFHWDAIVTTNGYVPLQPAWTIRPSCFCSYGQSHRFTPEINGDHEAIQCINKAASNQSVDARNEYGDDEGEAFVLRA
jgi:hypothetical protein